MTNQREIYYLLRPAFPGGKIKYMKKLYKSDKNKMLAGIFGGLGEYFDIDPTVFRLIGLIVFLASGLLPGIVFYIIAAMLIPKRSEEQTGGTS
jgi:phage shock protein C